MDARIGGGIKSTGAFKEYPPGKKYLTAWNDFLAKELIFHEMQISKAAASGREATVIYHADIEHKGKHTGMMTFVGLFTVNKQGKVSRLKIMWSDPTAIEQLFAIDPATVATNMEETWIKGGDVTPFFSENCVLNASGHHGLITGTDAFKVYHGHRGLEAYLSFLASMKYSNISYTTRRVGDNYALQTWSYEVQHKGKISQVPGDVALMKVEGGKITDMEIYWSNPEGYNFLFSNSDKPRFGFCKH